VPQKKRLRLVPATKVKKDMTVLTQTPDFEGPLIKGEAGNGREWLCGACSKPLMVDLEPGQVTDVILRCTCGVYNDGTI